MTSKALILCASCGARIGGRSGCQAVFDDLVAKARESPVRASVHNLLVDAYTMQHTEEYGRSAKSFAAHLIGLCCGVEFSAERELYWAIPRWLDGAARVTRPVDIGDRGKSTIDDVREPADEADYPELVRNWADDVWACLCRSARDGPELACRRAHGDAQLRIHGSTSWVNDGSLEKR